MTLEAVVWDGEEEQIFEYKPVLHYYKFIIMITISVLYDYNLLWFYMITNYKLWRTWWQFYKAFYFQTQVRTKDEAPTAPTSLEVSGFNQVREIGKTKTNKRLIVEVANPSINVPTPWWTKRGDQQL